MSVSQRMNDWAYNSDHASASRCVTRLSARLGEAHPDLIAAVDNRAKIKEQLDVQLRGYESALVGRQESGARFQLTIGVDDCDSTCAELASRGVTLINGPMDREWGLRTAAFADPDGHIWEVAENIQGGGGQNGN